MDGSDRWKASPCAATNSQDKTIIDRLMLRFRPIAPKPVADGSSVIPTPENRYNSLYPASRTKRKYARAKRNSPCEKKDNRYSEKIGAKTPAEKAVGTLQLMPEKAGFRRDDFLDARSLSKKHDLDLTVEKIAIEDYHLSQIQLSLDFGAKGSMDGNKTLDRTAEAARRAAVQSWITVESVVGTCMDAREIGCTDEERMAKLEKDTCPGFISDCMNRVLWVNDAYKRMVSEGRYTPDVTVGLIMRKNLLYSYPVFTCGVRLQYTWQNEKYTKTVPCDVCRMDCGGFAWRLDIKAALSLGL